MDAIYAKLLMGSALAFLVAACESREQALERKARSALAEVMIDPTTFLVRKLRAGSDPDSVCGEVNGKNRLGAYTGFSQFVSYEPDKVEAEVAIRPQSEGSYAYDQLYQRFCETSDEKQSRIEGEKVQARLHAEREAALEAERKGQRERELAAENKRREEEQLLAEMIGAWSASADCSDRDGFNMSRDVIGFPHSSFTVRAFEAEGRSLRFTGKTITSSSVGELGHLDFRLISRSPLRIGFNDKTYYHC